MKRTSASLSKVLLTAAVLAVVPAAKAVTQDEAKWQEAVTRLNQSLQEKDKRGERNSDAIRRAVLAVGDATFEKRDKDSAALILNVLHTEFRDDSADGSREVKIDGRVLDACEVSFKKIRSKPAVDFLIGQTRNNGLNPRIRCIVARTLGLQGPEAMKALLDLTEDGRDARLQIGAVDGMAAYIRHTVGPKVTSADRAATDAAVRAGSLAESAPTYFDEATVRRVAVECDSIIFHMDSVVGGQAIKDPAIQAIERLRSMAAAIDKPKAKQEVEVFISTVEVSVVDAFKAVEELADARIVAAFPISRLIRLACDQNRTWEIRIAALAGLRSDRNHATAEPLIEALSKCGNEDGRLKIEIMNYLGDTLGVRDARSDDPIYWKTALAARRGGKPPDGVPGMTTAAPTEFFGLRTRSTRIVFILDRTGSMDFPCTEQPPPPKKPPPPRPDTPTGGRKEAPPVEEGAKKRAGEIKKKWDDRRVEKRMDMLKKEFINTIYALDPRVMFAVITYEATPTNWKPVLVKATWPVKLECIHAMDQLTPNGGTNIWDALVNAFQYVAEAQKADVIQYKKGNYGHQVGGADTFFLMTDGNHNTGSFANDDTGFYAEFKKINAIRKVVVNTIILGDLEANNPDPIKPSSIALFQKIAKVSGGEFKHMGK